jgi:(+)-trans-carveol dehydrogenase
MGRVEKKVAFITGAARGQGRAHAVRLAEEGADIIALDSCADVPTIPYPMATPDELAETARQVEAVGRRAITITADVRDFAAMKAGLDRAVRELGGLDIVVANAGVVSYGTGEFLDEQAWQDVIDINLTGAWNTCRAAIAHMVVAATGGSMILVSSVAGLKGMPNTIHYTASKHGVVGVMRTLANELAPQMIRVNTVHPTSVSTQMIHNQASYDLFRPDLEKPTLEDARDGFASVNAMPRPWVECEDISNAVLFLASDESRYITGVTLPIDLGQMAKA